jgi:hypothetical protein
MTTSMPSLTLSQLIAHQEYRVMVTSIALASANVRGAACNASDSREFVVALPEVAPLAPPANVAIQPSATTSTGLTVTWEPPALEVRGGRIVTYRVAYQRVAGQARAHPNKTSAEQHQEVAATSTSAVLSALEPAVSYSVRICAATAAGCGPYSTPTVATTLEDGLRSARLHIN